MIELDNPVIIDRIELGATLDKKPQIALFANPLTFPVLVLFESQFGLLFDVGFDPNQLTAGQPVYTRFLASWEGVVTEAGKPKLNKDGNQYKNVSALIPNGAADEDRLLAALTKMATGMDQLVALVGQMAVRIEAQTKAAQASGRTLPPGASVTVASNSAAVEKPLTAGLTAQSKAARPTLAEAPTVDLAAKAAGRKTAVPAVTSEEWLQRAGDASVPFDFDLCISRAVPFYTDDARVESARESMFGEWDGTLVAAYVAGLTKYAAVRTDLEAGQMPTDQAHREAKAVALVAFRVVSEKANG